MFFEDGTACTDSDLALNADRELLIQPDADCGVLRQLAVIPIIDYRRPRPLYDPNEHNIIPIRAMLRRYGVGMASGHG